MGGFYVHLSFGVTRTNSSKTSKFLHAAPLILEELGRGLAFDDKLTLGLVQAMSEAQSIQAKATLKVPFSALSALKRLPWRASPLK